MQQRQQFNPDIQIKYDHLIRHMTQKNTIVQEFIRILKQICDAQIFYSRSLDKFANNISKLMVGKDPLKEVFIIFERAIAAKSEQSMQLANSIKDDMIPFIQKQAIEQKEQNQLRAKQKMVKDSRANMQKKLKGLQNGQNSYKRTYEMLKKYNQAQTRQQLQQKERLQKQFAEKESMLIQTINSYNHTVEEYLLNYSSICQKLSDIQTNRKLKVRDGINKYMIFEISCIKNIQYNIPRYMKNLQKMGDRLIIQDRPNSMPNDVPDNMPNLAKISITNYICSLNDRDKIDIPSSHKRILEIKKNTVENTISMQKYQQLAKELYVLLDEATVTHDVRVLKEIVYFARNVATLVHAYDGKANSENIIHGGGEMEVKKDQRFVPVLLLDAVMCHHIFQSVEFWAKYGQKLFDIIQRQSKPTVPQSQTKQMQISLNFIGADLQFLRIVGYHQLPLNILSQFILVQQNQSPTIIQQRKQQSQIAQNFQQYLTRVANYIS